MENTYKPDVSGFFRPLGLTWTLDDIMSAPRELPSKPSKPILQKEDILYLHKNDICENTDIVRNKSTYLAPINSLQFVLNPPGNLKVVKDTVTGEIRYYREQKVSTANGKMTVAILRQWWVRDGNSYKVDMCEVADQKFISGNYGNMLK